MAALPVTIVGIETRSDGTSVECGHGSLLQGCWVKWRSSVPALDRRALYQISA